MYSATKAPPGSAGIFIDRSRHVEMVVLITKGTSPKVVEKAEQSNDIRH
jgi:hypothetical protein